MKHSEVLEGRWDWLAHAILGRKIVRFRNPDIKSTTETMNLFFDVSPEEYKVIEPEAYRPWTADEVPMPCVVRRKDFPTLRRQIVAVSSDSVVIADHKRVSFTELFNEYEHQVATLATTAWLPCGEKVS